MKLIFNTFDPSHCGEKKQIPVDVVCKKKMAGEYYYYVVFPSGRGVYMPLAEVEKFSIRKINPRNIKTI